MQDILLCPACREEQPPESAGRGPAACCWKCGTALDPADSPTCAGSLAVASTHAPEPAGAAQEPPSLPSPPTANVPKGNELAENLALAYVNRAGTLVLQGDLRGAAAQSDQAIVLYERLVNEEGRHELAEDLVRAYRNKGVALRDQGDFPGALAVYDRAIALLERLVHGEGRQELILGLVQLYILKATAIRRGQGDAWVAVALYDRAVDVCRKLGPKQRREAAGDGACVVANRAKVLLDLGIRDRAASDARAAVPILRAEASRTGRTDLHDVLEWALRVFRDLLE